MSDRTIDKLAYMGNHLISKLAGTKMKDGLVKSKAVVCQMWLLFEYAVEIVTLAKHNRRYAKTNAVLLRVLIEIFVRISQIKKHVIEYRDKEDQDKIIRAFELIFCRKRLRHFKKIKESLEQQKKDPRITVQEYDNITKSEERIRQEELKTEGLCFLLKIDLLH